MSKKTTLLTVVIAAVLLLAVVAIALNAPNRQQADEATSDTTETTLPSTTPSDGIAADAADRQTTKTITYTDGGFDPSTTTVKAGDTIRIMNRSSMPLSFNSDDHPAHTDQDELNVGDVPRNRSQEFTVTQAGTWGYHNHENAAHSGKLIVE